MNENLIERIINPINSILGKRAEKIIYYDVNDKDSLEESKDGIHIIAHQIEFIFEEQKRLFISWDNVRGWEQYTVDCSLNSYGFDYEHYEMTNHELWKDIIGTEITNFKIYGYQKYEQKYLDTCGKVIEVKTFKDEPHLIQLFFSNQKVISVANFYLELSFIPTIPIGDDIWIFFDQKQAEKAIIKLQLEKLE